MIGNHDLDWTWIGSYHWENLSDEEFCKIDNVYPRTETKAWWVGGVFPCGMVPPKSLYRTLLTVLKYARAITSRGKRTG